MRTSNHLIPSLAVIFACGLSSLVVAQEADRHQIGLIDMAHVFKNYEKFKALTEGLQAEITRTDAELQEKAAEGRTLQEKMNTFTSGSQEYEKVEEEIVTLQAEIRKLQLKKQREFVRKEADLYKDIYSEVTDAVSRYSKYYKYSLILRFDRGGLAAAENPQAIVEGLNQQILYHRNRDDLTDPILNYLNEQWRRTQQSAGGTGGTTR